MDGVRGVFEESDVELLCEVEACGERTLFSD